MRWRSNKHPTIGERRRRRFFAWTPFHWKGTNYWLEWVIVREEFGGYADGMTPCCGWFVIDVLEALAD